MKTGEFLLDTNIVIGLLSEVPEIVRRFDAEGTATLSVIALGELYYGAYNSKQLKGNLDKLEQLLLSIQLLDCDLNTAIIYGELKQYLRTQGKPIPDNDLWIAAQCKQHGLTLVTRDAHFSELPDLSCENW
jgi:tRNA(fMet)-specific endonuclease VapC